MLLRSMKLVNFRQYGGTYTVEFSCDSVRNVTVILGMNTSGKTTLVQAFRWALYGEANFPTRDFLLNYDIANALDTEGEVPVEVELTLTHRDAEYTVRRTQWYRRNVRGDVKPGSASCQVFRKQHDGQTKPLDPQERDRVIGEILPRDLADYFFFDGERIEKIGSSKDLTEAVKRLLGLTVLENARIHLDPTRSTSVIGRWRRQVDTRGDERLHTITRELEALGNDLVQLQSDEGEVQEQIAYYSRQVAALREELSAHEHTRAMQKTLDDYKVEYEKKTQSLARAYEEYRAYFARGALIWFAHPLVQSAMQILAQTHLEDVGIPEMSGRAIDYLIQRGRCVCGASIAPGSAAYEHLVRERTFLPPESLGTVIGTFRKQAENQLESATLFQGGLDEKFSTIAELRERLAELEEVIEEWRRKLKDVADLGQLQTRLDEAEARLAGFQRRSRDLNQRLGATAERQKQLNDQYQSLLQSNEKHRKILRYIQYAEAIYDWLNEAYENAAEQIRSELEQRVNAIFQQMYHGRRTVTIDGRYQVTLLTRVGSGMQRTDESVGLETVKNFAFVAGLLDLARTKIVAQGQGDAASLDSEPYPLVMDAPFSNADEQHVASISAVLPTVAEQVIMVVMQKDWEYAKQTLAARVGRLYQLDKQSETQTVIREETSHV